MFIKFCDYHDLSDNHFDTIYDSFSILDPEYFDIISNHCKSPKELLRRLLTSRNNLFSDTYLYIFDEHFVGFVNYFPLSERFSRVFETNKILFKSLKETSFTSVKVELQNFSLLVSPFDSNDDLYLQSIFVFDGIRISGVGSSMYKRFEDTANSKAMGVSLHVRSDNAVALGFYKKLGFSIFGSSYLYLFLRKTA